MVSRLSLCVAAYLFTSALIFTEHLALTTILRLSRYLLRRLMTVALCALNVHRYSQRWSVDISR
jgi:hypothetical protein